MCGGCKSERDEALSGNAREECLDEEDYLPSIHPACACEWEVISSEDGIDEYDIPYIKDKTEWKTSYDF